MKIVFAGSPQFAVPTLAALVAAGYEILAVLTQPDRPVGREQKLQAPPVKQAALRLGLIVHQPEKIRSDPGRALMESLRPDAVVVVGYGQILPLWLLELPRYGCINLHASLLPAYRGAAPIQWAVANGETRSGVTTMQMDPGMDTGPMLLMWETEIGPEETAVALAERLSGPGAELMLQTLAAVEAGRLTPVPQDDSRATKAPLLKKEHGLIDWNMTAQQIFNRLRGFTPWPGIYSGFRGKKMQIWQAKPLAFADSGSPPGILLVSKDSLRVVCGEGMLLEILEVQLEGRRRMSAAEFLRGAPPQPGEVLHLS
ncbi:MAG: methionyl-tRNA formyltransferase [Acidobacteria bacterium]|nr:methionyl-tRNA formyltransferase [Acidobacteriota bacterium]